MRAAPSFAAAVRSAGPVHPAGTAVSLSDRCVLCVGGLTGARNHYRAEIELRDGRFLHHDGGREDNLHRLTPMLAAADIVICASGNISHNAYHLVKSTCKKLGKPCVLVKGTGIASFLDGLGHLASEDGLPGGPSARGDRILRRKPQGM